MSEEKWVVDVPESPPPEGRNPSWVRNRRLPGTATESDVLELLKELVLVHGCARATRGGVEVSVYGLRVTIVRYPHEDQA